MTNAEGKLPKSILERATLRGNEYAWPLRNIPNVIDTAKQADLVNVGGQLQFRFAERGTCECYWVCVDTFLKVPEALPWQDRVRLTATEALLQFSALQTEYDFVAEGRSAFSKYFDEIGATDADLQSAMCFVWYVSGRQS
jgi:hypothetical protein